MKSRVEILEELIDEKEKALIQLKVQNQDKMKTITSSSFGLNAAHVQIEIEAIRGLESEVESLRQMHNELIDQEQIYTIGTKKQIVDFLTKADDTSLYKLILVKEGS